MELITKHTDVKGRYYFLLFFVALAFSLICCPATSPLIERHTIDSSVFIAMARMFLDGLIPYVDFFDHKGPGLILIQTVGQLILPYRAGAFIIVTINFFLVILIADRILRLFFKDERLMLAIIMFLLLFLTRTIEKGNSVEEFGLVPSLISLYIGLKYLFGEKKITRFHGFLLGLFFSFFAWIRVNDAGALCGITVFLFISSLMIKDYKSVFNLVFYFIIGLIPLTAVYLLFFYYHDAVYELIYATFLFNIQYSNYGGINYSNMWMNIVVIFLIGLGTYLSYKKERNNQLILFSVCIFLFSLFTINMGRGSKHYFTNYVPTILYSLILIFTNLDKPELIKKISKSVIAIFTIALIIMGVLLFKDRTKRNPAAEEYKQAATEMVNEIPSQDLSKTYYYGVESQFYTIMQMHTNYKYFVFQEWHAKHNPQIMEEIKGMMDSPDGPLWVMMQKSDLEYNGYNEELKTIVDRRYRLYRENNIFLLYKKL